MDYALRRSLSHLNTNVPVALKTISERALVSREIVISKKILLDWIERLGLIYAGTLHWDALGISLRWMIVGLSAVYIDWSVPFRT
jgi:hypothetical protein